MKNFDDLTFGASAEIELEGGIRLLVHVRGEDQQRTTDAYRHIITLLDPVCHPST